MAIGAFFKQKKRYEARTHAREEFDTMIALVGLLNMRKRTRARRDLMMEGTSYMFLTLKRRTRARRDGKCNGGVPTWIDTPPFSQL